MQPLHKILVTCKGCIPLTHGVKIRNMNNYLNGGNGMRSGGFPVFTLPIINSHFHTKKYKCSTKLL